MIVSAPAARASAIIVCNLRTLLPPRPNDSKSSRFMKIVGDAGPSAADSRSRRSTGVACGARVTEGTDNNAVRTVDIWKGKGQREDGKEKVRGVRWRAT